MPKDAKTAPGHLASTVESPMGTIQMRPGEVVDHAPPVMPTLTGGPVPDVRPPSLPPPRYELGEEIARGGMGRVVEATDTQLGRVVALKEALALDAESLRRFARETKITARLEHPAIVPVHDAGTMAGGAPYYVMRKIGGRPLERLVATAETLNQRLALIPHIVAAAHAVAHAHERGIVHRDIKPSNILCGELGETIVIDWGLAKEIGEIDEHGPVPTAIPDDEVVKTRAGVVFGTPGFMAPEQLRGNMVNERTDVYALGATLYHLLSRKPPHHAKTADEMMRAAAHVPATPIHELVPGVPPELATIVDKALAHDATVRYQNARALAEDLQRFLTGQIVASHHYTPREKLLRFVRKNRGPVLIAGAALVALAIGGTIAVTRVIGERDRADVEAHKARESEATAKVEQRRAEERADKLTLQQARSKVTSNPTEAIAMIKPLVAKQWREVSSIAAAARANGVAWSLPAPQRTRSLEMSANGTRALVAGDDGSVRIYDLGKRDVRMVIERGPPLLARFADDDRKVVVWTGARLSVLDGATGTTISEVTAASPIRDLEVIGVHAYWADDHGKLWRLDLAGKLPVELAVEDKLEQIAPSPDGRWIALRGENHLMLHDRTAPTAPAIEVMFGKTRDLDWSSDGAHLVALVELGEATDRQVVDVSLAESIPQIVHRVRVGNRSAAAITDGRMYTLGPMGVGVASRSETTPRKQLVGEPIGVYESQAGVIVAAASGGLAILTDDGDHSIPTPAGRLEAVDASAKSPYVLGMTAGRMLVWNMAELLPRRLAVRASTIERFVGSERLLAAYLDAPAEWLELATAKAKPLVQLPGGLVDITGSPDGHAACVVDAGHQGMLVVEDHEPIELGPVDVALFAGTQLVIGTEAGTIQRVDIATRQRLVLAARNSKLVHLTTSADGGWLAAAFADGTLWRMNLATGTPTTTAIGGIPAKLALQANGTLVFPEGRMVRAWRVTGAVEPLVELPKPVAALGLAGPDRAVAFLDDGTAFVLQLDVPNRLSDPFDIDAAGAAMSSRTGLIVLTNRGTIEVIDPLVPHRWTLASSPGLTFNAAQISADGRYVVGRRIVTDREKKDIEGRDLNTLLVWRLATSSGPDDTAAWLDQMTNAVIDLQTTNLSWR